VFIKNKKALIIKKGGKDMFDEDRYDQVYAGGIAVWAIIVLIVLFLAFLFSRCDIAGAEEIDNLLKTISLAESSGGKFLKGDGGNSIGVYQISNICLKHYNQTHKTKYTKKDLYNEKINRKIARWYLNWLKEQLIKHNKFSIKRWIFAYNSGLSNALKKPIPKSHPNKIYTGIYKRSE